MDSGLFLKAISFAIARSGYSPASCTDQSTVKPDSPYPPD